MPRAARSTRQWLLPLALAAAAMLCSGCMVGPDFVAPSAPGVDRYTTAAQPETTGTAQGVVQNFVPARDPRADWWTLFRSPELDALVRAALADSPTLAQAAARIREATGDRDARHSATTGPRIDGKLGVARQQVDPAALGFPTAPVPPPFTVYDIGIDVSYPFDLFGGTRRELEALGARVDYQQDELAAARLALVANVVTTALRGAALRDQIATTEALLEAQQQVLAIAERREGSGGVARVDVESQRTLLAQTAALLPPLRTQAAATDHALAVYVGKAPAQMTASSLALADFTLPRDVPLTLPSELARQRPDVRASEALLHEASANVGVATANLYPKFALTGSAATTRTSFADIANGINVWSLGLDLLQPVFHAGELKAQQRAAVAAFDAARSAYRQVVLNALQNVADALLALAADAQALGARDTELAAAEAAYRITRARFELGGVSQLALLDAQRQRLAARLDHQQAVALRLSDTAALLAASGGGWWAADDQGTAQPAPVSPQTLESGAPPSAAVAGPH